jgi:hypothetical protein
MAPKYWRAHVGSIGVSVDMMVVINTHDSYHRV